MRNTSTTFIQALDHWRASACESVSLGQDACLEAWKVDALDLVFDVEPSSGQGRLGTVAIQGHREAFASLGLLLMQRALLKTSEELVIPLASDPAMALCLLRNPWQRGLRLSDYEVDSLTYRFSCERFPDTPQLIEDDGANPAFGFLDGGEVGKYLETAAGAGMDRCVTVACSEQAAVRLARLLLDFAHFSNPFAGVFSMERRRFEVSALADSMNARFVLIAS